MGSPRVTVVVPTFNSMKFLALCLDTVHAQTYSNIEFIVYDNGSTDGTIEFVKEKYPDFELRHVPNIHPNGYREAIDHVIENCDSDWLTFISSDDFVAPEYVAKVMEFKGDFKVIQSGMFWVNSKGEVGNKKYHEYYSLEQFKEMLMTHSPVNNPTVFYHKDMWKHMKGVQPAHLANDKEDLGAGDYDMWCSLADKGIPVTPVLGYLGYFYRWHDDQCTWKVLKSGFNYDKMIQDYWGAKWYGK